MAPQGGIRTADELLYRPDCLWELHLTERWKKGDKKKERGRRYIALSVSSKVFFMHLLSSILLFR